MVIPIAHFVSLEIRVASVEKSDALSNDRPDFRLSCSIVLLEKIILILHPQNYKLLLGITTPCVSNCLKNRSMRNQFTTILCTWIIYIITFSSVIVLNVIFLRI